MKGEKKMDNEPNKQEIIVPQGSSPADMIRLAVSGGADLDKLEKLLILQERYEANEAKKAYNAAMAAFKANPPKIDKDKDVAYGTTKYSHASLANVTEKINSELSKYGLSASWTTKQNGQICVTCRITHIKGHSEETMLCAPSDTSGSKNAIQAIGSTITYLERYSLLALTGLATYDQDDDGKSAAAPAELIGEAEIHKIRDLLIAKEIKESQFLIYMKLEKLEDMPKAKFQQAMIAISNAKKKIKAK
mgnify:CR=1 FL=1